MNQMLQSCTESMQNGYLKEAKAIQYSLWGPLPAHENAWRFFKQSFEPMLLRFRNGFFESCLPFCILVCQFYIRLYNFNCSCILHFQTYSKIDQHYKYIVTGWYCYFLDDKLKEQFLLKNFIDK